MVGIMPPSPQQIWRFSSAIFFRKEFSETTNLWYNILGVNGLVRADAYEIATEAIREV